MNKPKFKDRQEKIKFLAGLKNGTRSINEIVDLDVIFTEKDKRDKAAASGLYPDGTVLFLIPDNGRKYPCPL